MPEEKSREVRNVSQTAYFRERKHARGTKKKFWEGMNKRIIEVKN